MIEPYYEQNGITIFNADCLDVLPQLTGIDHVITDPPYDEATHNGARTNTLASTRDANGKRRILSASRLLSGGSDRKFPPISLSDLRRVMSAAAPRRWTIATVAYQHAHALEEAPPDGLRFVRFGVWVKPDGMPQISGDRPAMGWEAVAIMHNAEERLRWNGGGSRAVWTYNVARGNHPTEKPVELVRSFIEQFTDPGDLILDSFMGSGTTLRAAKDLGRKAIGIEINERYCEIAVERLRQEVLL